MMLYGLSSEGTSSGCGERTCRLVHDVSSHHIIKLLLYALDAMHAHQRQELKHYQTTHSGRSLPPISPSPKGTEDDGVEPMMDSWFHQQRRKRPCNVRGEGAMDDNHSVDERMSKIWTLLSTIPIFLFVQHHHHPGRRPASVFVWWLTKKWVLFHLRTA